MCVGASVWPRGNVTEMKGTMKVGPSRQEEAWNSSEVWPYHALVHTERKSLVYCIDLNWFSVIVETSLGKNKRECKFNTKKKTLLRVPSNFDCKWNYLRNGKLNIRGSSWNNYAKVHYHSNTKILLTLYCHQVSVWCYNHIEFKGFPPLFSSVPLCHAG